MPSLPSEDLARILARSSADVQAIGEGDLLLTGGSGFLGSWLLESFLQARDALGFPGSIHALTRDPVAFLGRFPHLRGRRGLVLVAGNLMDFAFPEGRFKSVVHMAVGHGPADTLCVENLLGMKRVLDFAAARGAGQFLFFSSGAVYGSLPLGLAPIREDHGGSPSPLDPAQAYGHMKRAAECMGCARAEETGMRFIISRGFAFMGPQMPLHSGTAMGTLLDCALKGKPLELAGDGTAVRSYMYGSDLCAWAWGMLARGRSARPYNTGSSQAHSLAHLAGIVRDRLAPSLPVVLRGEAEPRAVRPWYVPCIDRAQDELDLRIDVGLEEAIDRTGHWLRGHRQL